jgi:ABC-type nitrate/sulfonate/bicarbonate transport system substrate-binding protein
MKSLRATIAGHPRSTRLCPPTRRRAATALAGAAAIGALALAGCGGEDSSSASGGSSSGSAKSVNYAVTSPIVPPQLPPYTGPVISGKEFGLDMTMKNLKVLNSTPTALQLLLSGQIDATSGAFLGYLQARDKQQQLRAFCPEQTTTNAVVVSTNPEVTSLADINQDGVRTLIESPGGPNDFFMNAALEDAGVDVTVGDLENTRIVENMEQRFTALASRNADVGVVWNYNVADLEKSIGKDRVHVLADFTKYPSVYLAYISTDKWLKENPEEAAAMCAAVLKTNKDLAADYDVFKKHVDELVEGKPPEAQVRMTWEAANGSTMWPSNSGLSKEDVDPLLQMAQESGAIKQKLTYEDVVDPAPFEAALELLGE